MSKELKKEERKKVSGGVKWLEPAGIKMAEANSIDGSKKPLYAVDELKENSDKRKPRMGVIAGLAAAIGVIIRGDRDLK